MRDVRKFWLSIFCIFAFGALTSNAAWLYYSNGKDEMFERQLDYEREKISSKIDQVLDRLPQTPEVVRAKQEIKEAAQR